MKLTLMTRDGQRRGKEKIIREATRYTMSYRQRVNINLKKDFKTKQQMVFF